jgi:hypothetical protein
LYFVLQRTTQLLESIYNKSMGVRIGLLSPDHQSLLLVLPTQLAVKSSREQNSGARTALSRLQRCIVPRTFAVWCLLGGTQRLRAWLGAIFPLCYNNIRHFWQ